MKRILWGLLAIGLVALPARAMIINPFIFGAAAPAAGPDPGTMVTVFITDTSAATWTVPADVETLVSVETIGGGAGGDTDSAANASGGGGGAYSRVVSLAVTPGASLDIQVGAGGSAGNAGEDTWFNGASLGASSVGAKGGVDPVFPDGGLGGAAASGVGTTKYSGGNGGTQDNTGNYGTGGGGAAGPHGNGGDGGDLTYSGSPSNSGGSGGGAGDGGAHGVDAPASTDVGTAGGAAYDSTAGGTGGANGGGAGNPGSHGSGGGGGGTGTSGSGGNGGAGGTGIDWVQTSDDAVAGPGGGGGGGGGYNGGAGGSAGAGGGYGGGGGGSGWDNGNGSNAGGAGANGIIVVKYIQPGDYAQTAEQLCGAELDCFAVDASTYADASYVGGPQGGTVFVSNTLDSSDNLANVPLDSSNLVNSGTSPKLAQWSEAPFVRWTPHNLVKYSQDISQWDGAAPQATVTTDTTTAPDGTSTADTLADQGALAGNTFHYVRSKAATIVAGPVYTMSGYAKVASGSRRIQFSVSDSGISNGLYTIFDIAGAQVGVTSTGFGSGYTSAGSPTITSVGNGWYRMTVTFVSPDTSVLVTYGLDQGTGTGALNQQYIGDGASGMYVWGAQVNRGYTPTPHLATTSAARIGIPQAYDTYEEAYGLLTEPAATNLALQSEAFASSGGIWSNDQSSVTSNTTTAPDGSSTADKLVEDSSTDVHQLRQGIVVTSPSTMSIYAKAGERSYIWLNSFDGSDHRTFFDLTNGAVGANPGGNTATITSVGNGWYRVTVSRASSNISLVYGVAASDNTHSYAGNGSSGIYVWGAQGEAGTIASSYIPTLGSTVTRAVDNVTAATSTYPHSATKGTVYLDFNNARDAVLLDIHDGTTDERIDLDTVPPAVEMTVTDGAAAQAALSSGVSGLDGARHQVTAAWAANDFDISADGAAVASDGSGTLPTMTTLSLGRNSAGSAPINGFIYDFLYVPRQVETEGP